MAEAAATPATSTDGAEKDEEAEGDVWEDITETTVLAASAMGVGEMLCGSDFSLGEAMSVLQLMDPKMDDGMAEPVESVPSRLERGVLKVETLSAAEALAVIQGLVSQEVAFYEGSTLGESVFSCLFAHTPALHHLMQACRIHRLNGQLVRGAEGEEEVCGSPAYALMAVVLGVFKTIAIFRKVVLAADMYEEEDCIPNSFGLYLGENVTEDDAAYLLAKAEEGLAPPSTWQDQEAPPEPSAESEARVGWLLYRAVHCRRLLLSALQDVSTFTSAQWEERVPVLRLALGKAKAELASFAAALQPELPSVSFAFDPAVLRSSKGHGPRRQVRALPFPLAASKLVALLGDLSDALGLFLSCESLQQLRVALERLSRRCPSVLVNSFLYLHLHQNDEVLGRLPLGALMMEHLVAFGVPRSVASSQEGLEFIDASCGTLLESLRLHLHNRSRQRARLEVLVQDLSVMQENAALLDNHFREAHGLDEGSNRHLLQWALDESLRAMQHYLLLGLELELYMDEEEVAGVLWYLECLLKYRINVIGHMQDIKRDMHAMRLRQLQEEEEAAEEEKRRGSPSGGARNKKKKGGGGKDKKGGKKAAAVEQPSSSSSVVEQLPDDSSLREDTLEMNVLCLLCRGSYHFITGLLKAQGQAVPPQPKFCSWEDRFFNRFKAFLPLRHPPMLSFHDFFHSTSGSRRSASEMLSHAAECFKSVRPFIDHGMAVLHHDEPGRDALRALARVAVSDSVSLAQARARLEQGLGQGVRLVVHTSLSAHRQIPVVTVEVRER